MKFKSVLAALALTAATAATSAQAADWGSHAAVELGSNTVAGWFEDVYAFSLGATTDVTASAVSFDVPSFLKIKGGTVELFSGVYGDAIDDDSVGGFLFNGKTAENNYTFSALNAGSYYYLVSGTGTGVGGGVYALVSTIPVPEPDTYAMLLAGIGMLGVMARRRMQ